MSPIDDPFYDPYLLSACELAAIQVERCIGLVHDDEYMSEKSRRNHVAHLLKETAATLHAAIGRRDRGEDR